MPEKLKKCNVCRSTKFVIKNGVAVCAACNDRDDISHIVINDG